MIKELVNCFMEIRLLKKGNNRPKNGFCLFYFIIDEYLSGQINTLFKLTKTSKFRKRKIMFNFKGQVKGQAF